jgi:RNA polymerase sigma-70 factor (ECF subfamily)
MAKENNSRSEFTILYDQYVDKIYRFIYYKTHHKETAEDLTSVAFVKALNSFSSFDQNKGGFSAWIYKIARNTVIDFYRSKKTLINIDDVWDLSDNQDIEREVDASLKLAEVKKYLKNLSSEQRDVIILRVWEGLSYKEIAAVLGKSENSCKMMFFRTIKKLKEEMPLVLFLCLLLKSF